jgi:feruloyl-CoA synthase
MNTTHRMSAHDGVVVLGPYGGRAIRRPDGSWLLRCAQALAPYRQRITEPLLRWARERPDQTFVAQRETNGDWRRVTFAQALAQVRCIGQALLDRGLSAERPLMILSGNRVEHALLALGAQHVGVPFVPVSPAYALLDETASKVRHATKLLTPGLVVAESPAYGRAIRLAVPEDSEVVLLRGALEDRATTPFDRLAATSATAAVERAYEAISGDTIAKFLFTSGSTREPKAVINTHRMLCSNQQMVVQCYPFFAQESPVLVDWLPWHHTASGNKVFGLALTHGGTYYIDAGKPTEDGIAETLRNLRDIAPTVYFTVPKGLEALTRAMRDDKVLRERFFSRLRLLFPAGAGLPRPVQDAVEQLALETVGRRIPMTTGLGMTETAPFAITAHVPQWQAGVIGVPAPGVEVKLEPVGDKLEVRYRGPNVTPGYWRQDELTRAAFDEEGFFRSGDAACFIDDSRPQDGLRFDGRIAEDFKLLSGTWVNVGALRAEVIAAGAPYIQDVVLTGHAREEIGMLVFLLPTAARLSAAMQAAVDAPPPLARIAGDPQVRAWAQALLERLAAGAGGSSRRITRAVLLTEPPSMAAGEITDKGSINQRAVLSRRTHLVERLYAAAGDDDILRLPTGA